MHLFYVVGLAECTSNRTTLIDGLRLHPEANGYAKRLLADLQRLPFGEQTERLVSLAGSETISSGFLHADSGTL